MSKYDNLDARKELEQTITTDLKRALEKRGFEVKHNGSSDNSASGNMPDIELFDANYHINVEVTKTTKSNADREFLAIKDHLEKIKEQYPTKKCFVYYISPETHYRMMNAIRDHDILNSKKQDMKILPLSFEAFEIIITKLTQTHKDQYTKSQIIGLFDHYISYLDDERILRIIHENLFSDDDTLKKDIDIKEENRHQQIVEKLVKDLLKLEDKLREEMGITHTDAIRDIIFLVFMKLYEEKREFEEKENRFKKTTFPKFQEYISNTERAVFELFSLIKEDRHLKGAKVFTEADHLSEKLDDNFVLQFFIEPFEKYHFYTTKVDGIGAAYEVLGMRAGKDVKAGQFFTPDNVVRFMVYMAELEYDDVVMDPACGTARFLVHSMHDMVQKVEQSSMRNKEDKIEDIKKSQLYGSDYDSNVAKLAKMNMYIHKDGKTNIMDKDGLMLYSFDNLIDVILTNPPLGDQSYTKTSYDKDFQTKRMDVIQKIDVTAEKIKSLKEKITLLAERVATKGNPKKVKNYEIKLTDSKKELAKLESLKEHDYKISGSQMKGGDFSSMLHCIT